MGTTKTSISRIEDLKTGYTQDFLEACAEALGVHPGILLTRAPTDADRGGEPRRHKGDGNVVRRIYRTGTNR